MEGHACLRVVFGAPAWPLAVLQPRPARELCSELLIASRCLPPRPGVATLPARVPFTELRGVSAPSRFPLSALCQTTVPIIPSPACRVQQSLSISDSHPLRCSVGLLACRLRSCPPAHPVSLQGKRSGLPRVRHRGCRRFSPVAARADRVTFVFPSPPSLSSFPT